MDAEVRLNDYQSVVQLKYIRDIVKLAYANQRKELTNIAMLASSGVNSHHVVSIVPMLLRKLMPVDIAGFFWANDYGEMIDAYIETPFFLSADALLSFLKFQNSAKDNWPTFTENVSQGCSAGYLQQFQTEHFYQSEYFSMSYERIKMRHIVDVVVHDGKRPYGAFLLMRSAENGQFSKAEVEILKIVANLLPNAFKLPIKIGASANRTYDLGIVVVDKKLKRKFSNLTAHQILWMMTRNSQEPIQFASNDNLDTLIKKTCVHGIKQAIENQNFTETRKCNWGEFIVKYMYDPELETVAVKIQQIQSYPCHVAIILSQENLTPTKLMITWLLLKGRVRKEIANLLLITEDTVAEHIQAIFKHFDVKSRAELVLKLNN